VTVKGKSAEENSIVLKKVVKSLFLWAKDNAIVFNDSKTELIHYHTAYFNILSFLKDKFSALINTLFSV